MIKAAFLLAFFAILAVASGAPIELASDDAGTLVNSATNPCESSLRDFAYAIRNESSRCNSSSISAAVTYANCVVTTANKFDGKPVDTSKAFEDCSEIVISHRDWCKKHEPESSAAKADLSYFTCPTRYQTFAGNKSFPKKGCDNMSADKIKAKFEKSCISGGFAGVSLDSLCNNKKCIAAMEDAHECGMDRYASPHSVCALLNNTFSFSVFCPEDTVGYKTFTKFDCKVPAHAYDYSEKTTDFKPIEKPKQTGSGSSSA
ncbi:hypothetical protein H696_03664 [Fonticula alba]|uniref:Uncharacterized protein n=1 Tax=Fonticula alba TaxID=691883 RepID=A0A058Z7F3_FONAL|nr:hypothetical protein H696_03664 [Fonticula alba]KCV70205.1 hypothetical protein H696_03664 [Fonticula alba]|eukprot:XP_009495811.1 hypothetical protein H696_03664 [Fonticula alba]